LVPRRALIIFVRGLVDRREVFLFPHREKLKSRIGCIWLIFRGSKRLSGFP
jgi:hypothetical protein